MDAKVRFRFNQLTGEVEIFEVSDEGTMRLPEAEHNGEHDRIAAELGNIIERNPRITEAPSHDVPVHTQPIPEQPQIDEPLSDSEKQEQRQRQAE
ncbi:hypothetical protein [Calothrix sp. PCC 6303]|uniref:hypothetical protein n=1 Tax=Calothrix sp. PCC 6303 TaxID=1170562 RepID=UPI0002A00B34|nr:hypothetical protein [Calothrix sp. PCC 6303]AFZ01319.1 hypothetical protein Cal6303_2303 [Calothrix sp. PCC 6303]